MSLAVRVSATLSSRDEDAPLPMRIARQRQRPRTRRPMKTLGILRVVLATVVSLLGGMQPALASNTAPVILVHGFAGFGPTEMLGYKYWGGLTNLETQLQQRYSDQLVRTAVVGPFS